MLRLLPAQVTAGSLILAAKGEATAYGDIAEAAFTEQGAMIAEVKQILRTAVKSDKFNYLMPIMVDQHVHFHIFPRYRGDRSFAGLVLTDQGWPGLPYSIPLWSLIRWPLGARFKYLANLARGSSDVTKTGHFACVSILTSAQLFGSGA